MKSSLKKFMGNKNTVTILGVVICIAVLYIGYNVRINSVTNMVDMPVAAQQIGPRTQITDSMITKIRVPGNLLKGEFYKDRKDIVGKYTNYNTVIAASSLFYKSLLKDAKDLPSAGFGDVKEGHVLVSYPVDMKSTYANSMEPETYINIYFKARNDDDKVIFGKFIHNIKVLSVKDGDGQNVFEASEEIRTPAYLIFALPENVHELFRKTLYIANDYDIELLLVPSTVNLTEENAIKVTSGEIRDYIMERTEMIDINEEVTDEELFIKNSDKKEE